MYKIKNNTITALYRSGYFSGLDIQFAEFAARLSEDNDIHLMMGAALLSRVCRNGDICLDLEIYSGKHVMQNNETDPPVIFPELNTWKKKLTSSHVVGLPGEKKPLILDENNRLYLFRYWEYEKRLADYLKRKARGKNLKVDHTMLKDGIQRLFPGEHSKTTDWQKIAAASAVLNKLCIITGGPGTGKTFTVAKIISLFCEQPNGDNLRILLSAPTGKGAAKLGDSIHSAGDQLNCSQRIKDLHPSEAYTIHRMLKPYLNQPYFQYNRENKLPADVVIIDEISMVDLALMSKLVQAVPDEAVLILIGDSNQLASVEAGSVLGDICLRSNQFTHDFCDLINESTQEKIKPDNVNHDDNNVLQDCIIHLEKSYRFPDGSMIGDLSRAVNMNSPDMMFKRMEEFEKKKKSKQEWIRKSKNLSNVLKEAVLSKYTDFLKPDDPGKALEKFNQFIILCALRNGPYGVDSINMHIKNILLKEGLVRLDSSINTPWYIGRPVMIRRNDYNTGLFNGDIGITMPDPEADSDELCVFFPGADEEPRKFSPHRLPEHDTVYTMTVHKAQGSEFDDVLLILPDRDSPVLTRELIYTAITRAKKSLRIFGSKEIINTAVSRKIERSSGLRDALWGIGEMS